MKFNTREEWLIAAVEAFRPMFKAKDRSIPCVQVSAGWPSRKATGTFQRAIGECWSPECSEDKKTTQIFISPFLSKPADSHEGVLATLLHEIVHAVVGVEHAHKKPFKDLAYALGLEGKPTHTYAGDELIETLVGMAEDLGPYPNSKLDRTAKGGPKKQTTRMIKCVCEKDECGFTVRMSRKWIDDLGAAHCPKHGEMTYELPPELDGEREIEIDSE